MLQAAELKRQSHLNLWKLKTPEIEQQDMEIAFLGFSLALVQCCLTMALLFSWNSIVYSAPLYIGSM